MTTTPPARPRLARRPLPDDVRGTLGAVAAAGVFLLVLSTAWLALVDVDGPFEDRTAPGAVLALLAATPGGATTWVAVDVVARRSGVVALAVLVVLVATGTVLLPRAVDRHESFVPQPNERYSCTGWSFEHYPPGVMDGTGTTYCVGIEHRVPDG